MENKISFKEKIKNAFLRLKKKNALAGGSFSVVLTVIVIAVILVVNIALSAVEKVIPLKFDMTLNKVNSISKENIDFLKNLDEDINVYVCSKKSNYVLNLESICESEFNCYPNEKLFKLTLDFFEEYNNSSKKITVNYIDPQSVEMTRITKKYSSASLKIGDVIVESGQEENNKYRILSFYDIYNRMDASGYASLGYTPYELVGSHLESSLTNAIAYIVNKESKSAVIYIGHSNTDYSSTYKALLENNNYTVDIKSENLINNDFGEYDLVVLLAPSRDFGKDEIEHLTSYLKITKHKDHGIIFIADGANPELPLLYDMLYDWGIEIQSGVLVGTDNTSLINTATPTAIKSVPTALSPVTKDLNVFVTGDNVPISEVAPSSDNIQVISCAATYPSVVAYDTQDENKNYTEEDIKSYSTIIESIKTEGENKTYVYAISSIDFIYSEWAENSGTDNKDVVLSITDRTSGKNNTDISFVDKALTSQNYAADITNSKVIILRRFLYSIPIIIIIFGIVVFIKRRRA